MWVGCVVGSSLPLRGFSPGSLVFLSPQKPTSPNSNSTRREGQNVGKPARVEVASFSNIVIYFLFI